MPDYAAENAKLRAQLRAASLKRAMANAGRAAGARNPERLHRMVDADAVIYDVDNTVVNAAELVDRVRATDPYLFEAASARPAGQPEAPRESAVNQALRAALPVPVPTDPAKASREIGDALRAVTGRGGRGRGRQV
jgi:hypothetical protein